MTVVNSFALFYGAIYPDEAKVAIGEPTYGDPVNILDGTLIVGGADPNYPGQSSVILGVIYGTTGSEEFVGNNRQALQTDVRGGVHYGPNDTLIGILDTGGGVGSTQITFRMQRSDASGIEGGKFEILATDRVIWTGTDGNVVQNLDPGNYTVRTTPPPGYEAEPDRTLNVGDVDDFFVATVDLIEPGPVPGGDLIQVRCQVYQNGTPVTGAIVTATLRDETSAIQEQTVPSTYKAEAVTEAGYAELVLYRPSAFTTGDGEYTIEAKHKKKVIWSVVTALPDEDSVYLAELIPTPTP